MIVAAAELAIAARRRRLAAFNVAVPLLLVALLQGGGAPAQHAALVYAVLFSLFGVFGSAIPLVRDAQLGLLQRLALTGYPPAALLAERAVAGAAIDAIELLPAALAIVLLGGVGLQGAAAMSAGLLLALLAGNLLGVWIAAAARSIGEAALLAAGSTLLLLHASGVFRTPAAKSVAAAVESSAPFTPLHHGLLGLLGLPVAPVGWVLPLLAVAALAVATLLAAPRLLRPLAENATHE